MYRKAWIGIMVSQHLNCQLHFGMDDGYGMCLCTCVVSRSLVWIMDSWIWSVFMHLCCQQKCGLHHGFGMCLCYQHKCCWNHRGSDARHFDFNFLLFMSVLLLVFGVKFICCCFKHMLYNLCLQLLHWFVCLC